MYIVQLQHTVLIWRRGGDSEHSCVAGNHSISMTQNFPTLHLDKYLPYLGDIVWTEIVLQIMILE